MSLRFCFLTTFYPPHNFGGDGIAVQRLARGLVRAGHQVTVIHDVDAYHALNRVRETRQSSEPAGLEVVPLRSGFGALSPLLTQQLGRPVLNGRRIARLLREGDFDVINYHNISLIGGPALLGYGKALKLYVAHEHWLVCPTHVLWRHNREPCSGRQCLRCQLVYRRPPQLWRSSGLLQRQLRHVDVFIALSEFSRAKHREFGFPCEMEVLPNFLPESGGNGSSEAARPQARPFFLFVGRLERLKGLQEVIPAFAGAGDADLVIAGDGEYGKQLRAQAAGMERVKFLGWVPAEQLAGYYRHAEALLMPSLGFETFGMTLLEAFQHGTPVLARELGPFPEIVGAAGGGELFRTLDELVVAMQRLLHDRSYRTALGQAGRQAFLERWSEAVVVPRYLEIVRQAAHRKGDTRLLQRAS